LACGTCAERNARPLRKIDKLSGRQGHIMVLRMTPRPPAVRARYHMATGLSSDAPGSPPAMWIIPRRTRALPALVSALTSLLATLVRCTCEARISRDGFAIPQPTGEDLLNKHVRGLSGDANHASQ
jgi:hypothetical protein